MTFPRPATHPSGRGRVHAALLAVLIAAAGPGAGAAEPDARAILKEMSDYLAAQPSIAFDYDATLEVVTAAEQKLGLASSGSVALTRPDRIRATRSGGFVDVEMIYDGGRLTVLGKHANAYAEIGHSGTIDSLVDTLRDTYGLPLPAADLLIADPYAALTAEVTEAMDLGSGVVGGEECDWLAFRTAEVDF